jgi:hypothetical protein
MPAVLAEEGDLVFDSVLPKICFSREILICFEIKLPEMSTERVYYGGKDQGSMT